VVFVGGGVGRDVAVKWHQFDIGRVSVSEILQI
jgi:hypothetical protein